MLAVSTANFIISFQNHTESDIFHLIPNFTQILLLIRCSKNPSLIIETKCKNTHLISATTSTQLVLIHWKCNWCKLKHAHTTLLQTSCTPV